MNVNATQLLEATTFSAYYNIGENVLSENLVSFPSQSRNLFYVSGYYKKDYKNIIQVLEFIEEENQIIKIKEIEHEQMIEKIIPSIHQQSQSQYIGILQEKDETQQIKIFDSEITDQSQKEDQSKSKKEILNINCDNNKIYHNVAQPVDLQNIIYLCNQKTVQTYDINQNQLSNIICEQKEGIQNLITQCDPHHQNLLLNVDDKQNIQIFDTRESQSKFLIKDAHNLDILDLDFNPNKQYYFQTCSFDNLVKVWDMRKTDFAVKCFDDFNNMPLSSKFNKYHDQLIITSFSDGSIQLNKATSISSAPHDSMSNSNNQDEDGLIKVYDEQEDSVYHLTWSNASAWLFASISQNGHFIINQVPSSEKYRIIL